MKSNDRVRESILEVIDNQIKTNTPPETNDTFIRLKGLGYSEDDAKKLIGQCLSVEIFDGVKHGKPYNQFRYIKNLKNLPKEPFNE